MDQEAYLCVMEVCREIRVLESIYKAAKYIHISWEPIWRKGNECLYFYFFELRKMGGLHIEK